MASLVVLGFGQVRYLEEPGNPGGREHLLNLESWEQIMKPSNKPHSSRGTQKPKNNETQGTTETSNAVPVPPEEIDYL